MFGNKEKAQYFRLANGLIITGKGDDERTGNYIGGNIVSLTERSVDSKVNRDAQGNPVKIKVYDLKLEDGNNVMILSLMGNQSATRDIIRCLANIETPKTGVLLIDVWASPNPANAERPYTNAAVRFNGQKVQWAEMPKLKKITLPNGVTYTDSSEADAKVQEYVNLIQARLTTVDSTPTPSEHDGDYPDYVDDMPM